MNNEANTTEVNDITDTPVLNFFNKLDDILKTAFGIAILGIILFPFVGALVTALREVFRPLFAI